MNYTIETLAAEEAELQLPRLDHQTAWRIGRYLVEKAQRENLAITIDLTRNGQQLFHYAHEGTNADNDEWLKRKMRTVYRFGHSSLYMGCKVRAAKSTAIDHFYVAETEFCFHGGCVPLMVRGTGLVGTLGISGLAQETDHALAVEAIRSVMRKK